MLMECRNFWIIPDLQIEFKLHRDWNMFSTKIQLAYKVQKESKVRMFFFVSLWGSHLVCWYGIRCSRISLSLLCGGGG